MIEVNGHKVYFKKQKKIPDVLWALYLSRTDIRHHKTLTNRFLTSVLTIEQIDELLQAVDTTLEYRLNAYPRVTERVNKNHVRPLTIEQIQDKIDRLTARLEELEKSQK